MPSTTEQFISAAGISQLRRRWAADDPRAALLLVHGIAEHSARYEHVGDWRTFAGYSDRERLAIEYAERFALDHRAIDDTFFGRLRAAYTDAEILDLTVCIGAWIALGRTMSVLGIDSSCRIDH